MRMSSAVVVLLPAVLAFGSGSSSADTQQFYIKARPPIGFVEFCTRNHKECLPTNPVAKLVLTKKRWKNLNEVNVSVNSKIEPKTDEEVYGVPERWSYPVKAGDCEDYALLKKRYLRNLGFREGVLPLAVVLNEAGEAHAVLLVLTNRGNFVLDNRRNEILRWDQTRYHLLQRQSVEDPMTWIALSPNGVTANVGASRSQARNPVLSRKY